MIQPFELGEFARGTLQFLGAFYILIVLFAVLYK